MRAPPIAPVMLGRREALEAGACDGSILPRSNWAAVWTHKDTRDEVITGFGATALEARQDASREGCPGSGFNLSILQIDWNS